MWIIIIIFVLILAVILKIGFSQFFMKLRGHAISNGGSFIAQLATRHRNRSIITVRDELMLRKFFDIADPIVTLEGLYSVTPPGTAQQIAAIIYGFGARTIVDGTAGMGGNTIQFAKQFDRVLAVEMNPQNYVALQHNVAGLKNVETRRADITKVEIKMDAVFMDPPWTGTDYKKHATLPLSLNGRDIADVVRTMPVHIVALKVPANFAWQDYLRKMPGSTIQKIGNFQLIITRK